MRRTPKNTLIDSNGTPSPVGTREERTDEMLFRAIAIFLPLASWEVRTDILNRFKAILSMYKHDNQTKGDEYDIH